MNSDSESLQHQLLNWFLTKNVITNTYPSVDCEEVDGVTNHSTKGEPELGEEPQTFQLGEIPTVQERFQAVLKQRLQIQIQNHPPLFPWETQLTEYPEVVEEPSTALVPTWGWMGQQSRLNLPVSLPEKVFRQLLENCQALVTSPLPLGAKLVQVVESLFPDDSQVINDLAGMVLISTYRSVDTLEKIPDLQKDYSDLRPQQQMALSLLAAKQLLENLTLPISLTYPRAEREWLTSVGVLKITTQLQPLGRFTKLIVQGELPTKGVLRLQGNDANAMAYSATSGSVSIELCCEQLNQIFTLEVEFLDLDQEPLLFVISPMM